MPDTHQGSEPSYEQAAVRVPNVLRRIPLSVRMFVYGTSFLALVLAGLPWLWSKLDDSIPSIHVELGWFRLIGVVAFCACLSVYLYAAYVLTSRGKGAYVEFDPPRTFVATGPYRWARNPVAGSLMLTLLAEAIALSSTGVLIMFGIACMIAHAQVIWLEEPLLRKRHGQAYVDYLTRVPRWIPRRPSRGDS
ncbi:MAG: isoprenylcysteine carboxylmethyltransferase family protein [Phycisphaerae bacterium]|nr:isoprenylcysteine carboxylmethyltransferase family protein [Phycisphaerae bacterium]